MLLHLAPSCVAQRQPSPDLLPPNISTTTFSSMQDATDGHHPSDDANDAPIHPRTRKPPKHAHCYITALTAFLASHPPSTNIPINIPTKLRYDIYGPLLLLPATSPLTLPPWNTYLASLPPDVREEFYGVLAGAFSVTHVAINAPISTDASLENRNAIRAPRITPLHGDFGDTITSESQDGSKVDSRAFDAAFWASVVQHGVYQTWAPLHTMFSRGNISEKSRIHTLASHFSRSHNGREREGRRVAAVDLYVGIGYFAFSYLKAGVPVVFGWDINPWSIEGCRRGALANKWPVAVTSTSTPTSTSTAIPDTNTTTDIDTDTRLFVYRESNEHAPSRLANIKRRMTATGRKWYHVRHVNLGLLPSSAASYELAVAVLALNDTDEEAFVHVHENVATADVDGLKEGIVGKFQALVVGKGLKRGVECVHVEYVKSWAPGVWHCVFDIRVFPKMRD
ncbi:tRNA wybutosine-synthesizing protein [Drechslerella dactyloides]|uniref:tRNA wybutosine-synthesizing protein 2 n=1 Tax=Drechslerella dactyloides TaxID=74499 RepID=A0AAD6IYJ1_DREDA|nr:tRNA wybutosine-synthesizing protein [Drechslerella dactyloides]